MEKIKKPETKIRTPRYSNANCWLNKTLNYSPFRRCWHCELKFYQCPFFQYSIVSVLLILFSITLSFLSEGKVLKSSIVIIFISVLTYSYFFTKVTEKIVESNFTQRQIKEVLEEAKTTLEIKVRARTRELQEFSQNLEEQIKERTKELYRKMEELEKFQKLAVGREIKMVELKKEIQRLKEETKTIKSKKVLK